MSVNQRKGLLILIIALVVQGCATVYTVPDLNNISTRHKQVAIIPFQATIQYNRLPKNVSVEQIEQNEEELSYVFQSQIYNRFLRRSGQYSVEFQDIDRTNMMLKRNNVDPDRLSEFSKDELARLLEVDAIISGQVLTTKPMSTGAALAVGILFDVWGPTNQADVTVSLHDGINSKLLWKFNNVYSGSVGSSPEQLTNVMMRTISRKFPYRIR